MSSGRLKHTMRRVQWIEYSVVILELPAKNPQMNNPQKLTLRTLKIHGPSLETSLRFLTSTTPHLESFISQRQLRNNFLVKVPHSKRKWAFGAPRLLPFRMVFYRRNIQILSPEAVGSKSFCWFYEFYGEFMKERKRESRKSSTHRHVEQNHPAMALSYANLEETTFGEVIL